MLRSLLGSLRAAVPFLLTRAASSAVRGGLFREGEAYPSLAARERTPLSLSEIRFFAADSRSPPGGSRGGSSGDDSNSDDWFSEDGDPSDKQKRAPKGGSSSGMLVPQSFVFPKKVYVFPLYRRPMFPGVVSPILVHNRKYIDQLLAVKKSPQNFVGLFLVKQELVENARDVLPNVTSLKDLHRIGVLGRISDIANVGKDSAEVVISSHSRILAEKQIDDPDHRLIAEIKPLRDLPYNRSDVSVQAYTQEIASTVKEILKMDPFFRGQLQLFIDTVDLSNPSELADLAASLTTREPKLLQEILETSSVPERLSKALLMLRSELDVLRFQERVKREIDEKVSKSQRKHLLQLQLKAIKKELGLETDEKETLLAKYRKRLESMKVPERPLKAIQEEMAKMETHDPASSEFAVSRNYLDWLTVLPWGIHGKDVLDLSRAEAVLNEDHYGLEDIKRRILEFIAVGRLRGTVQGKIICLVGPPGVGKTSVGRSIGRALDRKFYRFSVGGMHDVAEIKGHRRTYIGAMPGKIIQALKVVGVANPVIMIDEIDKLGHGWQGDPSSALLEVLDPQQNDSFLDHYLDVPFDFSKILFVCTANTMETIPKPLADRMEILRLSGYVMQEKVEIAQRFLVPQTLIDCGLTEAQCRIDEDAIRDLIRWYCREAGVRDLQKRIEMIHRKAAFEIVKGDRESLVVTAADLERLVGRRTFSSDRYYATTPPGVVMGLAWTSLGGAVLYIETTTVSTTAKAKEMGGKGSMFTTGQMGKVMKESSRIAHTFATAFLERHAPENMKLKTSDVHMHVPEGATPKDGPSAGVTMVTALLSLALDIPVKADLAMTGEVTLTGKVLPIGGVKEKTIAARRAGVKEICFPAENRKDWDELPSYIRDGLTAHFVKEYDEVFQVALPHIQKPSANPE